MIVAEVTQAMDTTVAAAYTTFEVNSSLSSSTRSCNLTANPTGPSIKKTF